MCPFIPKRRLVLNPWPVLSELNQTGHVPSDPAHEVPREVTFMGMGGGKGLAGLWFIGDRPSVWKEENSSEAGQR